jgi:hypothetical protein
LNLAVHGLTGMFLDDVAGSLPCSQQGKLELLGEVFGPLAIVHGAISR